MKNTWIFGILALMIGTLLLISLPIYASDQPGSPSESLQYRVGISGLGFLKISQGARAVGMADCFTALADDINAIYWNPAGLTQLDRLEYNLSYTRWLVNSTVYAAGLAYNTRSPRNDVFGISLIRFKPEDTEETTIYQPNGTGRNIDMGDIAVGLVYAIQLTNKFSVGLRGQWIQETLLDDKVSTVALDVSTLFYTGFGSSRVAMAFKNFGSDDSVENGKKFFKPLVYNIALASEFFGQKGDPFYLTVAGESVFVIDYDQRYHIGAEVWIADMLALRAGAKFGYGAKDPWGWFDYKGEQFTAGVGVKLPVGERKITFDFAYTQHDDLFENPIRVSLGGSF